jgi:hypothetical protein
MLEDPVHGFRDVVHDHIEIDFVLLIALSVEGVAERNHIGVVELLHDLEFSIFIALVLVNFLDRNDISCFSNGCLLVLEIIQGTYLEHDAKGAITDNAVRIICKACLTFELRKQG